MANTGSGAEGNTYIGTGNGKSGTFERIGSRSGLTEFGIVSSNGTDPFTAITSGIPGQLLQSNGNVAAPVFTSATYPGGSGPINNVIVSDGQNFISAPGVIMTKGTWTPILVTDDISPTVGYDVQRGSYIRIGDLVFLEGFLVVNSIVGGTGNAAIGGFPFNTDNSLTFFPGAISVSNLVFTGNYVDIMVEDSNNFARLSVNTTALPTANFDITTIPTNFACTMSLTYIAA